MGWSNVCRSCSVVTRQFSLLLWKNFLLQIRRPVGTFFELLFPTLSVAFLVGLRFAIPTLRPEDRCFVTFDSDYLTVPSPLPPLTKLYYTPNTTETRAIADLIGGRLPAGFVIEAAETEEVLVDRLAIQAELLANVSTGCFFRGAGIVFGNDLRVTNNNIEYTLRLRHEVGEEDSWRTRTTVPEFEQAGPRVRQNFYLSEGFLHLENVVGESIIEWKSGKQLNITVNIRQFPYPPYRVDPFILAVGAILPFFLMLSFIYSAGTFVKELVLEKESRIRESMYMMGLSQWILWGTWYLKQFIFLFISAIIMSILLKFGMIYTESNFFLILLLFTLFTLASVSFGYVISVWFNSARLGLLMGFLAWFLNYLPYLFIDYDTLSLGAKVGCCLLSNTCLGLGINTLSILEVRGEGLQFNNAGEDISADDNFNIGWVYGMLIVDAVWYYVLAWYINGVKPGTYGVPKPLYFPFQLSYWTGKPSTTREEQARQLVRDEGLAYDPTAHEEEPRDLEPGISIQNLTKIYDNLFLRFLHKKSKSTRKVAVDRLSLNMYKDQITALLGHNGAGKTTTTSILTGLYTPTSGDVVINGFSILQDMDQIRHSLGICPQHNVLFDRLTVAEHLSFFTRLKGVWGKRVGQEVDAMIADLQLEDKRKIPARLLSGGQKRKLSVGIALVGGSEIVVLDEPTSGMDPYARRATWDLLVKHKEGRTMLLTTHHMDEADLLGDRIAIMAEGKLRCSGSSLFLKSRYGVGYHMIVVKEVTCDSAKVSSIVTSLVNGARQVTDVGAELSFILPSHASSSFPAVFDTLEARKVELGISTFGVSVTTMEEVFMKVGEGTDESLEKKLHRTGSILSPSSPHHVPRTSEAAPLLTTIEDIETQEPDVDFETAEKKPQPPTLTSKSFELSSFEEGSTTRAFFTVAPTSNYKPNTGIVLWVQQFCAIFLKRFLNSLRFIGAYFSQLVIPMVFVVLALGIAKIVPDANESDPARQLRLDNSAAADDVTLFWAQIGGDMFSFSDLEPSSLRATRLIDITGDVQEIINGVQNFNRTEECCDYSYQFLDKFCATRAQGDLEDSCANSNFPYSECSTCLSCSEARRTHLPSCSNPIFQDSEPNTEDYCPRPPVVDFVNATQGTQPSGRLDSDNTYVADRLLTVADDLDAPIFFRRYQAGFVVSARDPPYSVCGCPNDTQTRDSFIEPLSNALDSDNEVDFVTEDGTGELCDCTGAYVSFASDCLRDLDENGCPQSCNGLELDRQLYSVSTSCGLNFEDSTSSGSGMTTDITDLPSNYTIDGYSSDLLYLFSVLNLSCVESDPSQIPNPFDPSEFFSVPVCNGGLSADRPVGAYSPPQDEQLDVTIWYNNQPFHMSAAALNAFHTTWLRHVTGKPDLSITVINHPLPRNLQSETDAVSNSFTGYIIGQQVLFGYSFLVATFILFIVQEKESKAKHLQFVSGVRVTSYWTATFAWDLLNALIPVTVSLILFAAFQIDAYSGDGLAAVFLLLLLTVWASIPFTYCFSFLFKNYLAAFTLLLLTYFFSAVFLQTIVVLITDLDTANTLHYVFLVMPSYALTQGLNDIFSNNLAREVCTRNPEAREFCARPGSNLQFADSVFDFPRPGIGSILTYLTVEGFLFFILTLLLEHQFFWREIKGLILPNVGQRIDIHSTDNPFAGEDNDVYAERKKVLTGSTSENDAVVIKDLRKAYLLLHGCTIRYSKPAVRGISLAIPTGECFGLLGVNGAGKTTTFGVLTGDLLPTGGTAIIAGYDIGTNLTAVQQRIGYCPQFDALIERLTGRELLTLFARLRGIPEPLIKEVVQAEITRLDLLKYADKRSGNYSGGNKRKLSTAIALVGNPPIVFLDEPTTGMDPTTRRYLWDVLTSITQEGRSIILTTHSMEECEALCTRLAIMVNGSFKCLGSIQHLKNKYGAGYTLQAKVKLSAPPESPGFGISLGGGGVFNPYDTTSLHIFIREAFPGALLLEKHQGAVTYQLPSEGVSWSSVFRQLEGNKGRLGIIDYSVSQTTLEQVFINFAQEQEEAEL